MTKKLVTNANTITFSMPPEIAEQMQEVMREEGRTMNELIREAPTLAMPNGKIQGGQIEKAPTAAHTGSALRQGL